ncbi:ribosome small subunit-dependent GTPase A [Cohnella panacarvi]|uniref:ribosome small subunit-dependent GTPase A n=1 Tax=Cohnella panacarvi TaxID=400776 RepID=UPI0004798DCB|nr:ribosome small subunit-dependent GTPase A [Cohnella panacarvi]
MKPRSNQLLEQYGWNEHWDACLTETNDKIRGLRPARVIAQHSHSYQVMTQDGEHTAAVSGKYAYTAVQPSDFPAVGDWVMTEPMPGESRSVIHALLPRRSAMTRRAAGNVEAEQVIGANIDFLFMTSALNQDFNIRKIERYLIAAWESGATPIVMLTKADLCPNPEAYLAQVEQAAPGVPVYFVSALHDQGLGQLQPYLRKGATIAVTGSSGVGKSTLLNWLSGQSRMATSGIRESDARGRHTTTHRELFPLACGALVMDTPGIRELQLWDSQDGWQQAFSDIEALAAKCRFRDCRHESEAGCAVSEAIASGELEAGRLANYKKTARELARQASKENKALSKQDAKKSKSSARSRKPSRYDADELD